jgi:hypothetical protein
MQALKDGEPVRVRRQRLYLPGDVLVMRRSSHWNAHRFLGYAPSAHGLVALTQADDALERDPAGLVTAIVGRAQCRVTRRERLTALRNYARALIRRLAEVSR